MNRVRKLQVVAMFAVVAALACGRGAMGAEEEDALIGVLQSDRPAQAKDQACVRLKQVGTAKSVPALARLLTDETLSDPARFALESMASDEAGHALRESIGRATGKALAGILDSLGQRRDAQAVTAIRSLLGHEDVAVASAAINALGKIGGREALRSLNAAQKDVPAALRTVLLEAALRCADSLAATDKAVAAEVYGDIYRSEQAEEIRTAAYRGLILVSQERALALIERALAGNDRAAVVAALSCAHDIKGEAATKALTAMLVRLQPGMQADLTEVLAQRGDKAASSAIVAMLASESAEVRRAALAGLGSVGDGAAGVALARYAAKATGDEQELARQSLATLRDAGLRDALLGSLVTEAPAIQREIVQALGRRQDRQAVPTLLKMAGSKDESMRILALDSLSALADAGHAGELLPLLTSAASDAERAAAERALIGAVGRDERSERCSPKILATLEAERRSAVRAALLRISGRIRTPEMLDALRTAIGDGDAAVQDAAIRTIAEFAGADAAGTLLNVANDSNRSTAHRVIALRGYWRLAGAGGTVEQRWKMCEAGMAASQRPEEKRLGLNVLGNLPHPEALKLAQAMCRQDAVRAEAETACVRIAQALAPSRPGEAKAALRAVEQSTRSESIRNEARTALSGLDQRAGYVNTWQVAGPYRQDGKQCQALFDVAFAPEQVGQSAQWKPIAISTDPATFGQVDLLPLAKGDQCVAYVKARVWSPRRQNVKLEIGSDDGNKVWIGGEQVHANNTMRPIQAAQDTAQAELADGWNELLVKVTQNNMGFALCVRIRGVDGSAIEGLKFE